MRGGGRRLFRAGPATSATRRRGQALLAGGVPPLPKCHSTAPRMAQTPLPGTTHLQLRWVMGVHLKLGWVRAKLVAQQSCVGSGARGAAASTAGAAWTRAAVQAAHRSIRARRPPRPGTPATLVHSAGPGRHSAISGRAGLWQAGQPSGPGRRCSPTLGLPRVARSPPPSRLSAQSSAVKSLLTRTVLCRTGSVLTLRVNRWSGQESRAPLRSPARRPDRQGWGHRSGLEVGPAVFRRWRNRAFACP